MAGPERGRPRRRRKEADERLDESSRESFPASDAPSWAGGGAASPRPLASTPSFWSATAGTPKREPLREDLLTGVCVVGGGFAGLSAAYLAAKEGRGVVVLDAEDPAGGQSALTTAHLSFALDDRFERLERVHGEAAARLAFESHRAALDRIEAICAEEGIACDFERLDGYLFQQPGEPPGALERELAAARRAGAPVELVERAPLEGFFTGPALRFPRQGQLHPVKYLSGLVAAIERLGGRVHSGSRVAAVEDGEPARVRLENGATVAARAVVVATNVPFNDRVTLHTRQAAYRSYVIAGRVPKGALVKALYWDTADPYHYARLARLPGDAEELLIVGGEDHKTGQAHDGETRFANLELWARVRFPRLGRVEYAWSGQVIEPADGLAFLGRNPRQRSVWVATGDSGHGTTHGTLAGLILADALDGRRSPWARLYAPSRPRRRGAVAWTRENANAAAQYAGYVLPADAASEEEIPPGAGAVLRRGARRIAAYRGDDGTLRELSAVCPHLGGLVCWNAAEKSWDCPVHGSRFGLDGRPLNGPASAPLAPVETPATRDAATGPGGPERAARPPGP